MTDRHKTITFGRSILMVMYKNLKIYASKPPVFIFGLLFPFFMFLSFHFGRRIDFYHFFPGLFVMSLFFLSTSMGPLITPWEKMSRTYERLLAFPVTIRSIILGDILTGVIYGTVLSGLVLTAGLVFLPYRVQVPALVVGVLAGGFCFASLGVLLAAPNMPNPSYTMLMSTLIRFPLIFISGIFIPLASLGGPVRALSYISPVTYLVDIVEFGLKGKFTLHPALDFTALLGFGALFCFLAHRIHRRNMIKG